MPRTTASRQIRLLPPPIDVVARAQQCGAAIAGEVLPGIKILFGHRDQHRQAGNDWVGQLAAQPTAGSLLFREFIHDDRPDIVSNCVGHRTGCLGKTGGIQLAGRGAGTERLKDANLSTGH
jgi:hypothetical protein